MKFALGLRVKTGWAAVVLLDGRGKTPRLLDSREIRLSDWELEHGRQPYHATFGVEQRDRAIIARLVRAADRYALKALRALLREYAKAGHPVRRAAIVVSSLTDPASIANQHMRAHASEGQLYRRITTASLERLGLKTSVVLEKDLRSLLARASRLGTNAARWRAEEKAAAAGAWLLLRSRYSTL